MGISFETCCPHCGCNEPVAIAQFGIIVTGLVEMGDGEFGGDGGSDVIWDTFTPRDENGYSLVRCGGCNREYKVESQGDMP